MEGHDTPTPPVKAVLSSRTTRSGDNDFVNDTISFNVGSERRRHIVQHTAKETEHRWQHPPRMLKILTLTRSIEDPKNYSRPHRLLLLCLLTLCASIDPMASTSFYTVLAEVSKTFQVDKAVANLCSSLDFVGVASTALFWSQTAQSSGRKTVLVVGLGLVVLFTALGASASSVGMLIAMRVLSSASAAGIIITGVAAVNDMWETKEKGFAMGIYFLGPLASPALGPVIGGVLGNQWGWRAILRFVAAMAGMLLLCVILLLPETRRGTALPSQHRGQPFQSNLFGSRPFLQHFYRPLLPLAYLRYHFIVILLATAAFSYTLTTVFSMTLQSTFSAPPQNFDPLTLGLLYLPYALGTFFASILGGKLSDHAIRRHAPVSGALYPENRVRTNAFAACALQLLALPSLGWALRYQAPWYATVVPAALLGMSCGLNLGIATTVLVDLVPAQAAGLMAMNSVGRNLAGAIGGSVAQPAMSAIGAGWLYIALCVVAIVNLGGIITVRVRGRRWRENMWRKEGILEERGAESASAEMEAEIRP